MSSATTSTHVVTSKRTFLSRLFPVSILLLILGSVVLLGVLGDGHLNAPAAAHDAVNSKATNAKALSAGKQEKPLSASNMSSNGNASNAAGAKHAIESEQAETDVTTAPQ